MKVRRFFSSVCGLILVGSLVAGCGSKQNAAPATDATVANPSAPASYKDTSNPQAQRYNEAIKQTNSQKSPYSR